MGLQRTLEKTVLQLKQSLFDVTNTYTILFVTWENEDTQFFESQFPNATVIRIPPITIDFPFFQTWKEGLQMHVSWRMTYLEKDVALFRYFLQIYLWMRAAEILKASPFFASVDLLVRARTDIYIEGPPLHSFYNIALLNEPKYIYFANSPRHFIDKEGEGCPDYLFFGSPQSVCRCLEILQYAHRYKQTYIETRKMWYPVATQEENILQPESTLYAMVVGEGFVPCFLPLNINTCR